MLAMVARISPYPIPELKEFLQPLRPHFYRCESLPVLERYATGLLADIARKSGAGIAEAVAGLSESAVYRLLAQSAWDEAAVNRQRIAVMVGAGDGGRWHAGLRRDQFPAARGPRVSVWRTSIASIGQDGQLPGGGDHALPGSLLRLADLWANCICPKRGVRTRSAGRPHGYRRSSAFTPSRNWPCCCSIGPGRRGFRLPGWAPMPVTATTPTFSMGWTSDRWAVWWASPVTLACVCCAEVAAAAAQRPLPVKKQAGRPRTHPHPVQVAPLQTRRCGAGESARRPLGTPSLGAGAVRDGHQAVRRRPTHTARTCRSDRPRGLAHRRAPAAGAGGQVTNSIGRNGPTVAADQRLSC